MLKTTVQSSALKHLDLIIWSSELGGARLNMLKPTATIALWVANTLAKDSLKIFCLKQVSYFIRIVLESFETDRAKHLMILGTETLSSLDHYSLFLNEKLIRTFK